MKNSDQPTIAAQYLQDWTRNRWEAATPEDVQEMLAKVSELADLEYAECSPECESEFSAELDGNEIGEEKDYYDSIDNMRRDRLAIWAVQVAALKVAVGKLSDHSVSINGLYNALGELSRGVSAETSFNVRDVSKIPQGDDLWSRAMLIAAIDKYPANRQDIQKGAAKRLGIQNAQVATIVNNYRSKTPTNRLDLVRLVGLAMDMDDCGDIDLLKELKK